MGIGDFYFMLSVGVPHVFVIFYVGLCIFASEFSSLIVANVLSITGLQKYAKIILFIALLHHGIVVANPSKHGEYTDTNYDDL